jgi:hypothetical protein
MLLADINRLQPTHVTLMGDIIDLYYVSNFLKPPLPWTMEDEIESTVRFLYWMREAAGEKCEISYLLSNHEYRLNKYILRNAEALAHLKQLSIEHLLFMDEYNIKPVDGQKGLVIDGITFIHGELGRGSARKWAGMTALAHIQKRKTAVCCGHSHRLAAVKHRCGRERVWGIETGCLMTDEGMEMYDAWPDNCRGYVIIEDGHPHLEDFRGRNIE